jgi:hypothetical protein
MALQKNIGLPFTIKEWRMLFEKDMWFLWQRPMDRLEIVLKRLTIWNVLKWYFFQVCVRIVVALLYPVLRLAYLYWNDIEEGTQTKTISEILLMKSKIPEIKFFRLGK